MLDFIYFLGTAKFLTFKQKHKQMEIWILLDEKNRWVS
jgi:hypothetical protein